MKKRKLVITHSINQSYLEELKDIVPEWEVIADKDSAVWEDHLQTAEVIAGWKSVMEKQCLQTDSELKWMQTWSAGVDSLPLSEFEAKNIMITSANGVHAYPISETIFALMLALTRKIHTYVKNQQTKLWHHSGMKLELHEKTIAIVGVGSIGKEVAKIAKAFSMKVIGVRHSGKPEEFVDEMYTTKQLNSILPNVDYVVVTLPLTTETKGLFGAEQFNLMKTSAFFINIGRGEIVVEQELIAALQNGKIAGAGLDVFEKEPLDEKSPLWNLENVIITPHTSGSTEHYDKRVIENILLPNLRNYAAGNKPSINLVDYSKGY